MSTFEKAFLAVTGSPPPDVDNEKLKQYWDRPVSELAQLREPGPNQAAQERHRIYSLMLMALVHNYWNGNKKGLKGTYPWNEPGDRGPHGDGDYLGHNIGALAVDGLGRVMDFEFNHNRLFNSSAEHAEVRLIRRVFAMAQLAGTWRPDGTPEPTPRDDYSTFADVTVYTSLESCSQCAGAMALARVREVVYLQTDPGMYFIGRILRNLTDDELRAPLPISGGEIALSQFAALDGAFTEFKAQVADKPFHKPTPDGKADSSRSVTSFLCTKRARDIYGAARDEFAALVADPARLNYPDHRPGDGDGVPVRTALTNAEVLGEANDFLRYATSMGRRGTPHR